MRPAPLVLSPHEDVAAAMNRVRRTGPFDAWPVADDEGLWGMVRKAELEQAATGGPAGRKLAELLAATSPGWTPGSEKLPHVHPDHSLSLALERMGSTGLNILPVVSRANVRELREW